MHVALLCSILCCPAAPADSVHLVENGSARCVIVAPRAVLEAKPHKNAPAWNSLDPDVNRLRLRDSIRDLAIILGRISGAKVEVLADKPPPGDPRLPIFLGDLAHPLGKPQKKYPYQQGFRIVVTDRAIGLSGESDLATSYAIYTLLDQLGCRWYMPGPLGEVLPTTRTLAVRKQDLSTGPHTYYRGLWYLDQDFARRNRLGGMLLHAGHALEMTVPAKLRETNPEVRAIVGGKADKHKVKWTHPLVAKSLADACLAQLARDPTIKSFSLSPDDGVGWDESDDAKFDAGDFDPAIGMVSKTDRLIVLANRVASSIAPKYPDVRLGLLAYADYTRPPRREKVHPSVVPQIAPITFSRAHPMTDDREPNNKALRFLIEGWGKAVPATSLYFYAYYLAEVSAPNPMITKWSVDIPIVYDKGRCRYWQPETLPNFETCLHAHTLGIRLAWDPTLSPKAIVEELHQKFYGHAARPMADYWHFIDRTWVDTPEFAGCGFGHLRRWPKGKLLEARKLLEAAKTGAKTDLEKQRIGLADESLALFEEFLRLRRNLSEGQFTSLAEDSKKYVENMEAAAKKHQPNFAFSRVPWALGGKGGSVNTMYFQAFYEATYRDASRVAREGEILATLPRWRWKQDSKKVGEKSGWSVPTHDDQTWPQTDVTADTWSSLGLHNYMGSLWYRQRTPIPRVPAGKKVHLWVGATDGSVKVFVNGKHIPHIGARGEKAESFTGHCQPTTFDITGAIQPGTDNQISLFCTRTFLNELGTGGLLAPVVLYREK